MGIRMILGSFVLLIEICFKPKSSLTTNKKIMPKCKDESTQTHQSLLNCNNFITFLSNWYLPDLLSQTSFKARIAAPLREDVYKPL